MAWVPVKLCFSLVQRKGWGQLPFKELTGAQGLRTDHRPLVWAPRQAWARTRHQCFSQEAATRASTLQLHPGPEVRSGQFTGEPGELGECRGREGRKEGRPRVLTSP